MEPLFYANLVQKYFGRKRDDCKVEIPGMCLSSRFEDVPGMCLSSRFEDVFDKEPSSPAQLPRRQRTRI